MRPFLSRTVERRNRGHHTTRGGHAVQHQVRTEEDGSLPAPGAAARVGRVTQYLPRTTVLIDPHQLVAREKADGAAVGRPERMLRVLSAGDGPRFHAIEAPHPEPSKTIDREGDENASRVPSGEIAR